MPGAQIHKFDDVFLLGPTIPDELESRSLKFEMPKMS
jgi:hypothetical protein